MSLISLDNVIKEMQFIASRNQDILDTIDQLNEAVEIYNLNEAEYDKVVTHLKLEILDIDRFVKVNDCKCVSNPRTFDSNAVPSSDGVLSNTIFGYTMEERAGTFGYIDLHGWFLDPSCYKTWSKIDNKIKNIVHGVVKYKIDENGLFVEDPNGGTGLEWLKKNINKIQFKKPQVISKDISYRYLEMNKDRMFINKYLVIPPFYRDKNTSAGSDKRVGVGGINKIYTNLIGATNGLTATQDYNFDVSDANMGRVQETILTIYDWFCGNTNERIDKSEGAGLSGKLGILRRTGLSKTSNFSSRLVISAPELKVEKPEDMEVTFDKTALPLYSVMTQFRDFVMFHARRFFENEFMGAETYPVIGKNGVAKAIKPLEPEITFSDERIKREMDRFLHGYNNRFIPVEIPVEGSDEIYYMSFKGRGVDPTEVNNTFNRRITWCDIFYIASCEAVKNKQLLITRFPIDFFSNQFTTSVIVSSTLKTEKVEIDGIVYNKYPYIREELIGTDTSNLFVDTLRFSNCYLAGIGGDKQNEENTFLLVQLKSSECRFS